MPCGLDIVVGEERRGSDVGYDYSGNRQQHVEEYLFRRYRVLRQQVSV